MNDKINLPDLIDLLEKRSDVEQLDVAAFVRIFWETIEEGLLNDGIVKVKGLGTLKLVGVESRESINVNTGERFEIQQHSKISFMADSSMRNIINKPFAHFESVILNENTTFDDIEESVVGEPDSGNDGERIIVQPSRLDSVISEAVIPASVVSVPETRESEGDKVPDSISRECRNEEMNDSVEIETSAEDTKNTDSIDERPENHSVEDQVAAETGYVQEQESPMLKENPVKEMEIAENAMKENGNLDCVTETENAPIIEEGHQSEEISILETGKENSHADVESSEKSGVEAENVETADFEQSADFEKTELKEEVKTESFALSGNSEIGRMERSESEDVSHCHLQADEQKKSSSLFAARKTLFLSVTVLLLLVGMGCFMLWKNNAQENVSDLPENGSVVAEVNEPKPVEEIKTADSISEMKGADIQKKEEAAPEVEENKSEKEKVQPEKSKSSILSSSSVRALATNVEGRETIADTVEYAMVGVLAHDTIRSGDTLAKFSFKYYGNRRLWQYIAAYNRSIVKNPNNVPIGTVLAIPRLELKK